MAIRSKDDIQFHGDSGRHRPAVNVKNSASFESVGLPLHLGAVKEVGETEFHDVYSAPEFTHDWIRENVDERLLYDFEGGVQEGAWEQAQEVAEEVFGPGAKVRSEGRSSGWAVVDGIDEDVDGWDAVALAKWRSFATQLRAIADDLPRALLETIYINEFERPELEPLDMAALGPRSRPSDLAADEPSLELT